MPRQHTLEVVLEAVPCPRHRPASYREVLDRVWDVQALLVSRVSIFFQGD